MSNTVCVDQFIRIQVMVSQSKKIKAVRKIMGKESQVTIRLDDPRLDGVADLLKASTRFHLSLNEISVSHVRGSDDVTFAKIGDEADDEFLLVDEDGDSGDSGDSGVFIDPPIPVSPSPSPSRSDWWKNDNPVATKSGHMYVPTARDSDLMDILLSNSSIIAMLTGPTGAGKSTTVRYLAKELGMTLYQVNGHDGKLAEHFFGDIKAKADPATGSSITVFEDGPIVKAMQEGLDDEGNEVGAPGLLFLDEVAAIPAKIAISLNRLLESDNPRRTITLDDDCGRVIRSHSGFRILLAANTIGRGAIDMNSGMYAAQMDAIDISTLNRVAVTIPFGYNRDLERKILMEMVGNDRVTVNILNIRDLIRDRIRTGELTTPFSTRDIVNIGMVWKVFKDVSKVLYYVCMNSLLPEERAVWNEIIMAETGTDIETSFLDDGVDML